MPGTATATTTSRDSLAAVKTTSHPRTRPTPTKSPQELNHGHHQTARTTSIEQVLATTELLEAILLQLPIRSVLLSQRISKTWHATITSSISLQRALFLRPAPVLSTSPRSRKIHFIDLSTPCHQVLSLRGTQSLLTSILPIRKREKVSTFTLTNSRSSATEDEVGSWRSMLLSQPPRDTECFIGNYIDELEAASEGQMDFNPGDSCEVLRTDAMRQRGEMFGLAAVRIERVGGVTMAEFAEASAGERARCDVAKLRGSEYRFTWAGHDTISGVVHLWEDIKNAQVKRQMELDENDDEESGRLPERHSE
ncbi:Putative F-box-like domain superfamily protein [Septoria linicola]|uniref:F-box-like domain superfamily protein n=1 Tax=Septoria linicola TaxID=215465 RepID=A0A9Q9AV38_9PEZI|nr:Putative F-box-like domain superfamily protein [Septoria linicola]